MLRHLASIVLCLAFLASTAPAHAASVTFDAPFCSGFSVSGTGPSYTLTCETMACSAYVSSSTALPGQPILILRQCPGTASISSYQWSVSGDAGCVGAAVHRATRIDRRGGSSGVRGIRQLE